MPSAFTMAVGLLSWAEARGTAMVESRSPRQACGKATVARAR